MGKRRSKKVPAAGQSTRAANATVADRASTTQIVATQEGILLSRPAIEDNPLAQSNLGVELGRQGRVSEGISHLQEALRILPNYPEAHNNLDTLLGRNGQLDEAITHLEVAIRLEPLNAGALCNLGDVLTLKGRPDEAAKAYGAALQRRPDFCDAHLKLGRLLAMTNDRQIRRGHQALSRSDPIEAGPIRSVLQLGNRAQRNWVL